MDMKQTLTNCVYGKDILNASLCLPLTFNVASFMKFSIISSPNTIFKSLSSKQIQCYEINIESVLSFCLFCFSIECKALSWHASKQESHVTVRT